MAGAGRDRPVLRDVDDDGGRRDALAQNIDLLGGVELVLVACKGRKGAFIWSCSSLHTVHSYILSKRVMPDIK